MESLNYRKMRYLFIGLQCDVFGVSLLLAVGLGASPFGILMANLALVIPLTIGLLSIIYDVVALSITKWISRARFAYLSLLYGFFFAVFFQGYFWLLSHMNVSSILLRIILGIIAILLLDVGKFFLYHGQGPKLSTVLLIYALSIRTKLSLNITSKALTFILLLVSAFLSFIHGNLFYQWGWLTLLYFLVAGFTLKWLQKHVTLKSNYSK